MTYKLPSISLRELAEFEKGNGVSTERLTPRPDDRFSERLLEDMTAEIERIRKLGLVPVRIEAGARALVGIHDECERKGLPVKGFAVSTTWGIPVVPSLTLADDEWSLVFRSGQ
jgi:hypothetical protein